MLPSRAPHCQYCRGGLTVAHLLLAVVVILFVQQVESDLERLSSDPCSYYDFTEQRRHCGFDRSHFAFGWACDPSNRVSTSELRFLSQTIEESRTQTSLYCSCPATGVQCSYQFAFAFVDRLLPPPNASSTAALFGPNFCPRVGTPSVAAAASRPPSSIGRDELRRFGNEYARLVRERRVHIGECDESILVLVVADGSWSTRNEFGDTIFPRATIYVSFGSRLIETFGDETIDTLQRRVATTNEQLRVGFPLVQALGQLIRDTFTTLASESVVFMPAPSRQHIPLYAWIVFAVCGVLFALMAAGLYLLKKTPRRGGGVTAAAIRAKSSTGDSTRRWKASSAGNGMTIPYLDVTLEDSDDVAPSSTNVNLIQLMMPHSKPSQAGYSLQAV